MSAYTMTPDEALRSLQDSIKSAESRYGDNEIAFASERYVMCINIALGKIFSGIGREERVGTLRILFGRKPGFFVSSKDMTMAGASALRDRLFGPNAIVDGSTTMKSDAVMGVKRAFELATGRG